MTTSRLVGICFAHALFVFGISVPLDAQPGRDAHWVVTWATAEVGRPQTPPLPGPPAPPPFMPNQCPAPTPPTPGAAAPAAPFPHFTNQTLRQFVHTSIGGSKLRVVLSNAYGTGALSIGAAHVALRDSGSSILAAGATALTFSGRPMVTIPPRAVIYSDVVNLAVPEMADLAIDLYLPGTTDSPDTLTMHNTAVQTSYVSEKGNYSGAVRMPIASTIQNWFVLHRVEVAAADSTGTVVLFGDSITDGTRSTPDSNSRWPDQLAKRLLSRTARAKIGIANAGIAGNRVLTDAGYAIGINALARFEHHALTQPGVSHIVVLEGINDIGQARESSIPSADDLIAAYHQLIDRAHARGLKIIGATLTPFWGAAYYTEVGEAKRVAVNEWIRTGKAYDGIIDFDKATRDPNEPKKFLPAYDSCDHLHPSDAGYKAMAEAIDLSLFN